MAVDVVKRCRVGSKVDLREHDPGETFGWDKAAAQARFTEVIADVAELQERLFAEERAAMLAALQGTDALGTAKVLAKAIGRSNPDLILAATESSDGYTGTVPVQIAELLGLPAETFAKEVSIDGGVAHVKRQTELGLRRGRVPVARRRVGDRRCGSSRANPSFKGIMAAKSKPVDHRAPSLISGSTAAQVGWAGAGQVIVEVAAAPRPAKPARSSKTTVTAFTTASSRSGAAQSHLARTVI